MRDQFQIWVDAVCERVRFRPDRKAIEAELRIHYEDHVNDLLRLGRPRELAEERALAAMGNAQEVGWALDKVHKPWLGWLWEFSRFLALALALLLVWKIWQDDIYTQSLPELTWDQLTWSVPSHGTSHTATDYLDLWLAPGEPEPLRVPYYSDAAPLPGETRVQVPLTIWAETRDVFHDHMLNLFNYWDLEIAVDGRPIPFGSYVEDGPRLECGYWVLYAFDDRLHGWTRYRDQILLILDGPPRQVEVTILRTGNVLTAGWEGAA